MARESLLDHVPLPADNIHRVRGELEPEAAAQAYVRDMRDFFDARWPTFDVVLLGMGEDGHIASLFPGSRALSETTHPVVGVTADYQDRPARRVTLTPPAINSARQVIFLVTGAKKANTLRAVLEGPHQPQVLPAQIVRPTEGHVAWLMDSKGGVQVKHLV
jgi:6-phosphogluconolactonase